jgi:hypothetical protein
VGPINGLESLHGRLKQFSTLLKRMKIGSFVCVIQNVIHEWSEKSETVGFRSAPIRTTALQTAAWSWVQDKEFKKNSFRHLHITNKQLHDSDNSSFYSMGAVFKQ